MALALAPDTEVEPGQSIEELELNVITPAPDNPRRNLGDLTELAASMTELGLLQPLVVTPRAGKFMVVCGHRRYAAAKKAKLATVPAIIRSLDEPQRIKAMLIENCQREGLATIEEAHAYRQLVELGLTQKQIAGDVGKSQGHISKRLQLLELPDEVLTSVDSGGISIADALDLAALTDHPKYLKRVLERPGWQTVDYAVAQAKSDIERQARMKSATEKLKANGITPVKLGAYGDAKPPAKRLGKGWNQIDIDAKAHAKLDCHAVGINPNDASLVAVCTAPENHPDAQPKNAPIRYQQTAEQKRAEKEQLELQAIATRRLEYIGTVANGKVTKDDLLEISLYAIFTATDIWQAFSWTCRMLNLPIPGLEAENAEQAYEDLDADEAITALTAYASQSATSRLRAAFALAACAIEELECRHRFASSWGSATIALFTVLERHGYKPAPAEKKLLDKARKAA